MPSFAAPYARALAAVVEDAKVDPGQVEMQLVDFAATLDGSKDFKEVLLNPTLPAKRRVAVLDAVNKKLGAPQEVRNFLAVLIEHERLASLHEILEQFRLEMNRRMGISEVQVTTARPVDGPERAELEDHAARLAGTEVRTSFDQDPSLIGGVIVRIGSIVYDGSVRGRLERLKEQLVTN